MTCNLPVIARNGNNKMRFLATTQNLLRPILKVFFLLILAANAQSSALPALGVQGALYNVPGLGNRPLLIKNYPGVENVQSDLYEVYMEPFNYDLHAVQAVAVLQGEGESPVKGEILFIQRHPPAGPVIIKGNITGLPTGKHGFHIHQAGDMRNGCEKLGEHYNPFRLSHGGPRDHERHVGDLGNLEAGENGEVQVQFLDPVLSLNGPRGVIGRALVVTENEDDMGRGNTADSINTGSSGKPVACGVIAYVR